MRAIGRQGRRQQGHGDRGRWLLRHWGLAIPHRREPGQAELPAWKEEHNASHRKVRARVEHISTCTKSWKILRDCRLKGDGVTPGHPRQRRKSYRGQRQNPLADSKTLVAVSQHANIKLVKVGEAVVAAATGEPVPPNLREHLAAVVQAWHERGSPA